MANNTLARRPMRRVLLALVPMAVLLFAASAFAQTGAPTGSLPGLTPSAVAVAVSAAVAAFLVSAWNSGKIFGVRTVPQTWLPYLGLLATFVTAVSQSMSNATSALSGAALFAAGLAGFYAIVGYSVGAGAHGSIATHIDKARAARAAHFAKEAAVALVLLAGLGMSQTACTQAQLSQLEQDVLTDVENGSALGTIETVVLQFFPGLAGDMAAVDSIVDAVLSLLESTGALPTASVPNAVGMQAQVRAKIAEAKKTSSWEPSPALDRSLAELP